MHTTAPHYRGFLAAANTGQELLFLAFGLEPETAAAAAGTQAVCPLIKDDLSAQTLKK